MAQDPSAEARGAQAASPVGINQNFQVALSTPLALEKLVMLFKLSVLLDMS